MKITLILNMLIPLIPSFICAYYAYKADRYKRKSFKFKKHKKVQSSIDCIIHIDSSMNEIKFVNIKTTVVQPKITVVFITK